MKCIKCGREINIDSKYCKYCGTSVEKSIEANRKIENDQIQCPTCKRKVKQENSFLYLLYSYHTYRYCYFILCKH